MILKYYLTSIIILNGEREYGEQFVVKAKNYDDARNKTEQWLQESNSYEEMSMEWKDDQLDLFDEVIEFQHADEIPESDYLVLQRYLPIVQKGIDFYKHG